MQIRYSLENFSLYFYLQGELDQHYAKGVKDYIDNILEETKGYKKVVFNLADLSFMDSTGIGILLGRYKKLKKLSVSSFLEAPKVNVEKVLELSGIYEVMPKI
ncbi:MAG: anti-sigma factor antagonist [Clostridia bacterium]|nr:anti-sigma factor antagonist [Clostridia bacterium]MBQ4586990.1 anti-sigma factor antagonist [Clostridia bacterium]MBQ6883644.1 anti-sigma factor antagonist [Clostridia bacterium]MBR2932962.1 anti-sigma factor antagonist [Clostridia bacterium]MBR6687502.1 anti-sigma factor antagonist [Clostridia bacterium]